LTKPISKAIICLFFLWKLERRQPMTLESISIEGFKSQAVPYQGQYPSATVSPVRHPSDALPALQNFLRRMDEVVGKNADCSTCTIRPTFLPDRKFNAKL